MIDDETLETLQQAAEWAAGRHFKRYGFLWHVDRDELYASALLAAYESYQRWDPSRCPALHGYLRVRLDGALLDDMRRRQGRGKNCFTAVPIDPDWVPDEVEISDGFDAVEHELLIAGLRQALERDGERLRDVDIIMRVIAGEAQSKVALSHGISPSRVCKIVKDRRHFMWQWVVDEAAA